MNRTSIDLPAEHFPACFRPYLEGAKLYDSSCSRAARVYFIDKDGGYYLKSAPAGTLQREAEMTRYFCGKGLAAPVLAYERLDADWLLTRRVPGEDCTFRQYMEDPVRLCDTTAQLLRLLHSQDASDCPIDRTADYLAAAQRNFETKAYDASLFPDNWGYASAEEAFRVVEENGKYLRSDTLLHGDYCLPNIMLDNWKFSGFIDLDAGGRGDRHIDLFWGMWSLQFNLKTDRYRERFLDVYGREDVCEDMFPIISAFEVFG
ncbi:MAG: aminoglycoside 3'-phosphotransferase [Oscillospiraceae bacterium]|nr:aminoglycoside 3'-phosphotransferase [Oscillospiraceae bacterium]